MTKDAAERLAEERLRARAEGVLACPRQGFAHAVEFSCGLFRGRHQRGASRHAALISRGVGYEAWDDRSSSCCGRGRFQ